VVSEIAPGTEPAARNFPRRNRIVAGLSDAVVVVRAALRSVPLITAAQVERAAPRSTPSRASPRTGGPRGRMPCCGTDRR